jgi:hypothetical protein
MIYPHEILIAERIPLESDLRRLKRYNKAALKRQTKSLVLSLTRKSTDIYGSMFELPLTTNN